jgi:hypothetical protein
MAHRVDCCGCHVWTLLGVKRTWRERGERADLTKMTHCAHWVTPFQSGQSAAYGVARPGGRTVNADLVGLARYRHVATHHARELLVLRI